MTEGAVVPDRGSSGLATRAVRLDHGPLDETDLRALASASFVVGTAGALDAVRHLLPPSVKPRAVNDGHEAREILLADPWAMAVVTGATEQRELTEDER